MEQDKFRCHFTIIFENLGSAFWFVVMCFVMQMDDLGEMFSDVIKGNVITSDVILIGGILLGVLLLVFLYHLNRWARTWISIEKDAIVIERKTVNQTNKTIGIKNISNINIEQNLFERVMGTCKIKLDTNSKTTADSTDIKIVLSKEKAEYFKQQVMLYMNEEKEDVKTQKQAYDVFYSVKDILLHCLYTASITSILVLLGIISGFIVGIHSSKTGAVIVDSLVNIIGSVLAIVIILGSVLQGLVKDFFVYYGFKARRKDNKIYLYHGLLKKRQYTLAVDKINAVQVVSTTFSRLLKRQYVKVICIGVGDEENENAMLLLSETKENMYQKLAVLLPEFVLEEPDIIKREKKSVFSELPGGILITGILIAVAVAAGGMNIFGITRLWIRVLLIIGSLAVWSLYGLGVYLSFCTCGIGLGRDVLTLENGMFQKVITWIPYQKIQQLQYVEGPISRRFGLAKGIVFVLANVLNSMHEVSYFKLEVFDKLHEKIMKRQGRKENPVSE